MAHSSTKAQAMNLKIAIRKLADSPFRRFADSPSAFTFPFD
jgi:hypothetical protein